MSFLFTVRVQLVTGTKCETEWISTPGQEPFVASSRSAALIALSEAGRDADDRPCPLRDALKRAKITDTAWHRKNLERFVVATKVSAEHDEKPGAADAWEAAEAAQRAEEQKLWDDADDTGRAPSREDLKATRQKAAKAYEAAFRLCHRFRLDIEAADPKWLAHVRQGDEFGTTAYDAWVEH
jgi:hypothetical protein